MVRGARGCLGDPSIFHGKKDKLCFATFLSLEEAIPRRSLSPAIHFGHGDRLIPFVGSDTRRASLFSASVCAFPLSYNHIAYLSRWGYCISSQFIENFVRSRKLFDRNINSSDNRMRSKSRIESSAYMKMLVTKPSKFFVEIISIRIYMTILYYMQYIVCKLDAWEQTRKRERVHIGFLSLLII